MPQISTVSAVSEPVYAHTRRWAGRLCGCCCSLAVGGPAGDCPIHAGMLHRRHAVHNSVWLGLRTSAPELLLSHKSVYGVVRTMSRAQRRCRGCQCESPLNDHVEGGSGHRAQVLSVKLGGHTSRACWRLMTHCVFCWPCSLRTVLGLGCFAVVTGWPDAQQLGRQDAVMQQTRLKDP